jgi:flavin-dependent dehydrogenase
MTAPRGHVASTLTLADARRHPWQVVVVGGGPAGASCAARLASRGVRTLLVDRQPMPRGKVCGCCLSRTALAELADLAGTPAGAALIGLPVVPLGEVQVMHRGRTAALTLPPGGIVARETLDTALVRAAIAAGADWLPESRVMRIEEGPPGGGGAGLSLTLRHLPTAAEAVLTADFVIWATGLGVRVPRSPAAPRMTAPRGPVPGSRVGIGMVLPAGSLDAPPGLLRMAVGDEGYAGIVRLEDGRIDLAAALDPAAIGRAAGPVAAVSGLLIRAAGPALVAADVGEALREARVLATPALTRRSPLVDGLSGRVFRVGDAAGYVEPFTGEGIGWALAGGRLLATALVPEPHSAAPLPRPAIVARRYAASYRRFFGSQHRRCRRVAGLLRRPIAVGAAVGFARIAPWIASRAMPAVIGTGAPVP